MKESFVFKAHGWNYELSAPNQTGEAILTVQSQSHEDDPGAGSSLVKSALYSVCDKLELSTVGDIEHSGGWAQARVIPDSVESNEE